MYALYMMEPTTMTKKEKQKAQRKIQKMTRRPDYYRAITERLDPANPDDPPGLSGIRAADSEQSR
jgi:hypothetical protein